MLHITRPRLRGWRGTCRGPLLPTSRAGLFQKSPGFLSICCLPQGLHSPHPTPPPEAPPHHPLPLGTILCFLLPVPHPHVSSLAETHVRGSLTPAAGTSFHLPRGPGLEASRPHALSSVPDTGGAQRAPEGEGMRAPGRVPARRHAPSRAPSGTCVGCRGKGPPRLGRGGRAQGSRGGGRCGRCSSVRAGVRVSCLPRPRGFGNTGAPVPQCRAQAEGPKGAVGGGGWMRAWSVRKGVGPWVGVSARGSGEEPWF